MNAIEWLEQNAPGFLELPQEDRQEIFYFTLLWSLFEARVLGTYASVPSICERVHKCFLQGRVNADEFEAVLGYFRNRYFSNGSLTRRFRGLHLRTPDLPDLVESVLKGDNQDSADGVAVVLIIIYRFRNNLFHGIKWAYGIREQRENFEFANRALMTAISQLAADSSSPLLTQHGSFNLVS